MGMEGTCRLKTRGFTLVELLVVIVIITILSTLVLVAMMGLYGASDRTRARGIIDRLYTALETYKLQFGDYPGEAGGQELKKEAILDPLVDATGFSYDHADLNDAGDTLLDPWKQPYIYIYGSAGSNIDDNVQHPVKIYSCGKKNHDSSGSNPKYCKNWKDPKEGIVLPVFKGTAEN